MKLFIRKKRAYGDDALGQTQFASGFLALKKGELQLEVSCAQGVYQRQTNDEMVEKLRISVRIDSKGTDRVGISIGSCGSIFDKFFDQTRET